MIEQAKSTRERRIQTRYVVDLHAKVRGRNQLPTNCRVRNICNGGVLLETEPTEPELPFQSGDHVDIHFDLPDAQSMDPVQAVVEIVHRVDRGLGARFVRLAGDGRSRLARFVSDKAAAERSAGADLETNPVRVRAREVLQQVGEQRLGGMLDSLLETLVEELWSHTERAGSDNERTKLSGEISLLAKAIHNENFSEQLRAELVASFKELGAAEPEGGLRTKPPGGEPSSDGLQLVDPEEFELWLAKSELANRLENELREPLESLRTLISALFHGAYLPMEPMALAETIERTLTELGIGSQLQRIALQVVANHLSRNLGSFYREVLRAWTSAGLPGMDVGTSATAMRGQAYAQPGETADPAEPVMGGADARPLDPPSPATATPGAAAAPPISQDAQTISQAAGLMANLMSSYPPRSPYYPGFDRRGPVYTGGRRVADMLASMPVDYQMPDPDPKRPLRELVTQWLQAAEAKTKSDPKAPAPTMAPQVEERVDLTDRLLSLMLADPTAPQRVKSLIKPLTTRFLSMAVTEPGGITDNKLPLISLLNKLEHLANLLQNDDSPEQGFQKEFEEAIQKLVAVDSRDPKTIDEISQKVGDLESRAGREYKDNISNWVNICESKERGRLAREEVRARLNAELAGQRVHKVILELLDVGWRNLLDHVCANSGIDAPRWIKHWRVITGLQELTAEAGAAEDEAAAKAEAPRLDDIIEETRSGLTYMGIDPIISDELLERVENAVRRVRASLNREQDYVIFTPLKPDPESEPDKVPHDLSASDWEQALADVASLSIGSLIWMRSRESSKALRLIWRNDDGSRLAVTDTMGKKVKVLRRNRLAEAFARGQARAQAPTGKRIVTRAADAALSEMQERLKYQETHDPMTGLSNQRRLVGSLTQTLLPEAVSDHMHALCFLELDRYDTLTGTFGYSVGERMLMGVAKLLEGVVSDAVCLAYMGGSRFGILMPVMDLNHATEIGESIRAGLTVMPFDLQGKPFRISGSLGFTMLAGENLSPEKMVSAASVACLAAQREGGDRVVLFREDNEVIARQLEHMRGWAQAEEVIKAGRRKLRYQRIVPIDPTSGLLPHCEILLSVFDEDGLPLPLQSFIAAAEAFNMMREVDRQVIDETFKWLHNNQSKAREIGGVAINLSGQSLSDPDLLTYIKAGLTAMDIPVEMVSFEVTETAAIVNLDQAAIILDDIKALGCKVALDDFGAGMSSYSYLKRLPVDYVKIDGSFVKDILVNPHDREIVKSFNEIAHFMGKKTIAEYVENQEILELLRDIGVDFAQGYAIEKPQFIDTLR
ncbi:DUF1631 family protein [Thiocystis violacea]|uniref:DUF1631 family protein n=1 Tax=Thiocystis violacea TaxID=13725 RepID=UPI001904AD4C|nr:DUF1631 family protein [Thiocystis violacea]MBK1722842.1 diguanylate cyclase [Thiocystis violacea]